MKTKSKLRERTQKNLDDLSFFCTDKIARGLTDKSITESQAHDLYKKEANKITDAILQAFSEELDELEGKAIKGYPLLRETGYYKVVPLSAIKEMKQKYEND